MARKFKLTAQHYIDERLLEPGTIIGEGTEVPFTYPDGSPRPPTFDMEGLNDESQAEIDTLIANGGRYPVDEIPPMVPQGADPTAKAVDPVDPSKAKGK